MAKTLIAKCRIQIDNTVDEAWKALVNPEIVENICWAQSSYLAGGKAAA